MEGESRRAFEQAIPTGWVVSKPAEDHGVDLDVEVFEGQLATGIHFKVQLKSQEEAGAKPRETIKSSTREYWAELDLPTLIVLWDAETGRLWWKWSHLVDSRRSKSGAKTRSISFFTIWDERTASTVLEEIRGFRAIRRHSPSAPIYICFVGTDVLGDDPGQLIGEVRRRITGVPELTTVPARKGDLFIRVRFLNDHVRVRPIGSTPRFLHFSSLEGQGGVEDYGPLGADVVVMLAFAAGRVHQPRLGLALLRRALDSTLLIDESMVGTAIAELAQDHAVDELIELLKRTYFLDETAASVQAIGALRTAQHELTAAERRRIAEAFEGASEGAAHAARMLYNAAGLLRFDEPEDARRLYRAAADADERYISRGYWWSEQASGYFHEGRFAEAEEFYQHGLDVGDARSLPLLADCKLRLGKYAEAVDLFRRTNSDPDLTHAQWRLSEWAFGELIGDSSIQEQDRKPDAAMAVWLGETLVGGAKIAAALELDLINPPALWAKTILEREAGRPTLALHLAAAISEQYLPVLWEEALRTAFTESASDIEGMAVALDVIACIKMFCREPFEEFIHTDPGVKPDDRLQFMWLLENSEEPQPVRLELRAFEDEELAHGQATRDHRFEGLP